MSIGIYRPPSPLIYLADLTVYIPGTGVVTRHYSTANCVVSGVFYEGRLTNPGDLVLMLFSQGTTSGASTIGFGGLTLNNADGSLDAMLNYGFVGRSVVIKKFLLGAVSVLLSCTMEQPTPTLNDLTIRVKDPQFVLNTPVQLNKYLGDNAAIAPAGVEGLADIKGKEKPTFFGTIYNAPLTPVNSSRLIYQCRDGAVQDIPAVYDKGVALLRGDDYSSADDMQNNGPAPGNYRVYKAGGYVRLGSTPAGPPTFDGIEGATAGDRTAAQIAKRLILLKMTSGDIVAQDFTDLDTLNSAEVGIYINGSTTVNQALDQVLGSIGGWYCFDADTKLRVGRLDPPAGSSILTITPAEVTSLSKVATSDATRGVPAWRANVNYQKNWTVQAASALAGRVPYLVTWRTSTTQSKSWSKPCFGNGIFVMAAAPHASAMSPDGFNWTHTDIGATNSWAELAFGGGWFVGVSSTTNSYTLRTQNGLDWYNGGALPAGTWKAVCYGNSLFVAVGVNVVATSPDGATWTARTIPAGTWEGVTWNGSKFIAVSSSGAECATSPDGTTWTAQTISSEPWVAVSFGNGLCVAISSTGAWATSPDGITWRTGTLPNTITTWRHVAFGDGIFLAVPGGSSTVVATSLDGMNWVQIATPSPIAASGAVYGNGKFLTAPYSGSTVFHYNISPDSVRVIFCASQFRTVEAHDDTVKTVHLNASEVNVDTLLVTQAAAQAEADRLLAMHKVRRDYLAITCPLSALTATPRPGQTITLKYPRFGYDAGKLLVVMGLDFNLTTNSLTLYLWG